MLWGGLEESEEILFGLVGGRKGSLKKKKKSKGGMRIVGEKRNEKKTPTHQKNLSGQQQNCPKKNKRKFNEFPRRRAKGVERFGSEVR